MKHIAGTGMHSSKRLFQLHGVDTVGAEENVVFARQLLTRRCTSECQRV